MYVHLKFDFLYACFSSTGAIFGHGHDIFKLQASVSKFAYIVIDFIDQAFATFINVGWGRNAI